MDLGIRGDDEEGPCRETRGRCARELELERILGDLSPDGRDALSLLRAARGQFRAGFFGPFAFDYVAVESSARLAGIAVQGRVFQLFQVAEEEVLSVFEERRQERPEGSDSEE